MERILLFLKEYWVLVGVGVVGIGILIYGMWGVMVPDLPAQAGKSSVEIIKAGSQPVRSDLAGSEKDLQPTKSDLGSQTEIKIDVAGAVEKPGVYSLPSGSRIGDAIVAAGGLSAQADRDWIAKTLNLAQEVKDGGKVYIQAKSAGNPGRETPSQSNGKGVTLGSTSNLININTASVGELDNLTGIGEVRAQAIVANRPYSDIHELVTKAKVPESVYAKIKDSISLY